MLSKQEAVLYTLLAVAKSHGKPYCYPSQAHICKLVVKFYKLPMSRRNVNRILGQLVDLKVIERIRRHRMLKSGGILFASTLYKFKGKAFNYLISLGKRVKDLFSFFRVPKWAQYRTPHSMGFGSSLGVGGDSRLLEKEKGRASPIKSIL
jgi:hypothetical protein